MKLTKDRIEWIRYLATVDKVDGMLVQEWELMALCDMALASRLLEMVPHHLRGLLQKCPHYNGTANLLGDIEAEIYFLNGEIK